MTLAVMSDVHANLEALAAVTGELDRLAPDGTVFLGDLVGYNADPNACADVVFSRAASAIRGNHDKAAAGKLGLDWFNPVAAEAIRWTRRAARPDVLERLARLPAGPLELGDGVLACHGAPGDEDEYLVTRDEIQKAFGFLSDRYPGFRICLHGHTHVPMAAEWRGGRIRILDPSYLRLEDEARYLLNPGAVGQPRDGNPRASFAILETNPVGGRPYRRAVWRITRLAYIVRDTQRKILAAGLPGELAQRLAGGW